MHKMARHFTAKDMAKQITSVVGKNIETAAVVHERRCSISESPFKGGDPSGDGIRQPHRLQVA